MAKPKVVMLGTSLSTYGGVSTVVSGYLSSDLVKFYEIRYIATHCDGGVLAKLAAACAGYVRFISHLVWFRPDLIHIHAASRASFYRKAPIILVAGLLGKPIVYHNHGAEFMMFYNDESGPCKKKIIRWVLQRVSLIIAVSEQWKINLLTLDKNLPVQVVHNAVNMPAKTAPGSGKAAKQLLFMGKVCERKGVHDLIIAAGTLALSTSDFQLIIGGDGDIDAWSKICLEKSIENHVTFKGWVSGMAKKALYEQADIYVLPSYNEGLPMSVLEAISYGLPVVATTVGGIPEAVIDGLNGYLIKPGDVTALAERLHQLISDNKLRLNMGKAARQLAEKKFDLPKVILKLDRIYSKILKRHEREE